MPHLGVELLKEPIVWNLNVSRLPGHLRASLFGDLPHRAKLDQLGLTLPPVPEVRSPHLPIVLVAEQSLSNKNASTTTLVLTEQKLVHMASGLRRPHPL